MAGPARQTFRNEVQFPSVATVKASQPEPAVTFRVQSHSRQQHITQDPGHCQNMASTGELL